MSKAWNERFLIFLDFQFVWAQIKQGALHIQEC